MISNNIAEPMDGQRRIKSVAVYCGSRDVEDGTYAEAVVSFARCLVANGIRLVYGGSNVGMMKVLADSVLAAGGEAVGVFSASLPERLYRDDLSASFVAGTLAERKAKMIELSDALVALPGGIGTWDELFDALALRHMKRGGHKKPVGLLNVGGYYDKLLDFIDHAKEIGYSSRSGRELVCVGRTPEELFKKLVKNLPPKQKEDKL